MQYMKINEIFYSIQGEGYYTGSPAVFIRFSNCNLSCEFCDTNHTDGQLMSYDYILSQIKKYNCNHIVLTGGEPTLQITSDFLFLLKEEGYYLQIETNGTNEVNSYIDWVTVSPKKNWVVKKGSELKVVYQGQDLDLYKDTDFLFYYLQPCSNNNIKETINKIKEECIWKLSIQMHKILNIQ